ncbi:iron-containing alcohol dehydrogenase [Rhodoplanes sp. TEM]|uniref:Iron-containing alcohol dehydrogenase n=1 Tax=Rhodoplanes tepidamans TaxID=200616 RepID=A0ABT5J6H1_RHOTP|nr:MULTISPECIES: iron-containing alcohol dehydrogenase [Rhodoplanes]MDC7785032.1 iron-containing alcohol dehydrogenase [Rhodoplanes tepidamans]MDC7982506.1 iron-containing alcohol dehydrogenase [Rhodoplanes sp. TEM]MDQ0356520.1 alcohol dehydrogenase class IV [Rhodoplanes tepidamans]
MPAVDAPLRLVCPPVIEFGAGTVARVGAWAKARGCRRPLVVADAFNVGRVELLGLDGPVAVFGDVVPEPDIPNLDALLATATETAPDLVVGFGGGSAMDLAKLAAVLPGSGQTIRDVVGVGRTRPRCCALVQVPTTAGTGSEGGIRALVTDPATRNKLAVESLDMLADLAVVDPDLTMSVPPALTAATGVDAMAHCVEAYTNRRAHPLIDFYAIEGIRQVGRHLARAVADGSDRAARRGLAVASLYGGFCLGPVNTAAGHALAYPLGTRHHVPHGAANALIFPHVLAFNAPVVPEKTRHVLAALGLPAATDEAAVRDAAYGFCAALGLEMRLSGLGVPEDDLPAMADEAFVIRRLLDNNPREISRDEILAIYRTAF